MKVCRFDKSKRCYHSSCSWLSGSGEVILCPLYHGGDMFSSRRVGFQLRGVFDKHALRRGS